MKFSSGSYFCVVISSIERYIEVPKPTEFVWYLMKYSELVPNEFCIVKRFHYFIILRIREFKYEISNDSNHLLRMTYVSK